MILALTNCCTTNNELKDEDMKNITNKVERPPSPGNAEITCSIEDVSERGNRSFCKIKVSSVLNYGSGTRPIGNSSIIELEFKKEVKAQLESFITNKQESILLISEVPGGKGFENSSSYKLIKIIK
jgi:hypothetical protein